MKTNRATCNAPFFSRSLSFPRNLHRTSTKNKKTRSWRCLGVPCPLEARPGTADGTAGTAIRTTAMPEAACTTARLGPSAVPEIFCWPKPLTSQPLPRHVAAKKKKKAIVRCLSAPSPFSQDPVCLLLPSSPSSPSLLLPFLLFPFSLFFLSLFILTFFALLLLLDFSPPFYSNPIFKGTSQLLVPGTL